MKLRLRRALDFIRTSRRLRDTAILVLATILILYFLLLLVDRVIMPLVVHRTGTCLVPRVIDLGVPQADSLLQKADLSLVVIGEEYDSAKPPGTILSQIPSPDTKTRKGRAVKVKISKEAEAVLVPRLKGISLRQAGLLLGREGLELGEVSWVTSDSFPKDVVVANTPASGVSVPPGISVNLEVSLGVAPDTVSVPDLVGKSLEEGKGIIREMGLQLGKVKYKKDDDFAPGTILEQSLPAGEKAARGSEIDLEVSATVL
ncbi:MAG: PASTA domain-containing protein [Candidatus Zixiibacteriota bacterium]